ncbi:MAG: hypothetical protein EBR82_37545 [Caulobacteraceae bacterium]|nr:hypothetical protein [Caulobacteraceae bacterium]
MTFEEWLDSSSSYRELYDSAYTAGQQSMRPLVEKMRADLSMVKRLIEYGDGDIILAGSAGHKMITESIAEADKFLGEK